MRVLIVHTHPEPQSFTAAMRDVLTSAFRDGGDDIAFSDLYAMSFNPVVSAADFIRREQIDRLVYAREQRAATRSSSLSSDIATEVEKVLAADLLAFTFPLFWFGPPAMLKGWIERVFLAGVFYGGRRIYDRGGLTGKRAFAAIGLGGREGMFGPDAIHGMLENGMLRHFFQGTLGYVGLSVHRPFFAHHVPYVDDAARTLMLGDLANVVRCLDTAPFMPMPRLSDYDGNFMPSAAR